MRVATSYKHNRVDPVCSIRWQAPYAPDALPCGARRIDSETRFVLTALGRRALLIAWLTEPGPTVAEAEAQALYDELAATYRASSAPPDGNMA